MSIVATDVPMLFLFFEPGGRPRRFAFLAMETSMNGAELVVSVLRLVTPKAEIFNGRLTRNITRPMVGTRLEYRETDADDAVDGAHSTASMCQRVVGGS